MARWFEPSEKQASDWLAWVARQPEAARQALAGIEPWELYRHPDSGLIVTFHGLKTEAEAGKFTVFANLLAHEQYEMSSPYYGSPIIDPSSLEPYTPKTSSEMMMLAHRASGEPSQAH